jgi:general secretion pathway protein H
MESRAVKVLTQISGTSRSRGFSLLELMIVCVLLMIAAGLVGSFLSGSDQKTFTTNLRQVSALLKHARRQAIVTGVEQHVRLDVGVTEPGTDGDSAAPPPDWSNPALQLRYAASVDDPLEETTEVDMTFFPLGSSTGGLIELTDGEREAYLYVFPLTGELIVEARLVAVEELIAEARP